LARFRLWLAKYSNFAYRTISEQKANWSHTSLAMPKFGSPRIFVNRERDLVCDRHLLFVLSLFYHCRILRGPLRQVPGAFDISTPLLLLRLQLHANDDPSEILQVGSRVTVDAVVCSSWRLWSRARSCSQLVSVAGGQHPGLAYAELLRSAGMDAGHRRSFM